MSVDPIAQLRSAVHEAADSVGDGKMGEGLTLERPPKPELGDYSTNAAMLLAPSLGQAPREIAERIRELLSSSLGDAAERLEVAGPGFVNLFLADRWHREAIAALLGTEDFGSAPATDERILVEFVSANPTGPLTAASGRHAAYGDALCRVLEAAGRQVEREYYVNDAGSQIERFGASIAARMRGDEPPEDGYSGEYVALLAEKLRAAGMAHGDDAELARRGVEEMLVSIRATLAEFRVEYDDFASERAIRDRGAVESTLERIGKSGLTYESAGALWLRSTDYGDDKDRVLIRSGGEPTYFAVDIAYHSDKLERGFDRLIDVLGADHHGYIGRMRAAIAGLERDPDAFEALIMQFVHVIEGGGRAQMSKRRGEFVTLDELIADVGTDAIRFFLLARSHDTTVDLDLDLARKASQDNPVYYVQYAHARITGILAKALAEGGRTEDEVIRAAASDGVLAAECGPAEGALLRRLLELPQEVRLAAERRAPHRLSAYATSTAADFHAFYRDCRVVGAPADVESARLALCLAAKRTIATTLSLLGIDAPGQM